MEVLSSSFLLPAKPLRSRPRHRRCRPISAVLADEPLPRSSLAISLTNALDSLIDNFLDPAAHRPSFDPSHVLAENFAPVPELPPSPCHIISGRLPPSLLGGIYLRNGPNPQHLPRGPHHVFDGDGMIHSLLLSPSSPPLLSSRFVHTYRYLLERAAGHSIMPKIFSGFHGFAGVARGATFLARMAIGQVDLSNGISLANTSLFFFGGRLFALAETDLPYAVHVCPSSGDVTTVKRFDFEGKLSIRMTSHPKKDPLTGEVFAFSYDHVQPFLTFFRFDREGNKVDPEVPIFSLSQPSFFHDFAMTENFAVFCDMQIVVQPMKMVLRGKSLVGTDTEKVSKVGVIPKYATSDAEMRWYEVPGFNLSHTINAWEEGDELVLVGSSILSMEHAFERMDLVRSCVEMVRIELKSGVVSRTPLSAWNLDFGVINNGYVGRKNRYAYLAVVADSQPKVGGVVKLDMEKKGVDCVVGARMYGGRRYGGEPIFVAAPDEGEREDDGYLVTYMHDEDTNESWFLVMDARSPELEVVTEIALPSRVPYGLHGIFLTSKEIASQRRGSA